MIREDQIPIIKREYQSEIDNLNVLKDSIIQELNEQLDYRENNIEINIHGRVKSEESLFRKYEELKFDIKTIKQIDDLIGIRIVCLLLRDVSNIVKTIKSKYPNYKKHYNPADRGSKDKFNYNSNHVIIEINGFHIEIQIRTLSQHTWAQVSRKFNYKNAIDVPQEITRPLFRSSAHLESADIDLDKFVVDRESHLIYLSEQNIDDILDQKLNFDTLRKTLAIKIPDKYKDESDELLYFSLIRELRSRGIDTIQKLVKLIDQEIDYAIDANTKSAASILKRIEAGEDTGYDEEKIRNGIRMTTIGMMRSMYNNYYRKIKASS